MNQIIQVKMSINLNGEFSTKEFQTLKGMFKILNYQANTNQVKTGTETRQKFGGRSCCRQHGELLLIGLILMTYTAFFLIALRTTKSG